MKLRTVKLIPVALTLVLSCGAALAADPAAAPQPPQSVSEILNVQHGLRERLDRQSGEYARFTPEAISRMERAQDKVFVMLNGVTSLDQLNPQQRTDLSNSLDEIRAILLANEGNRQICHRERRTGSNLIELRCETVAEREAHARESQEEMRRMAPTMQTRSGG